MEKKETSVPAAAPSPDGQGSEAEQPTDKKKEDPTLPFFSAVNDRLGKSRLAGNLILTPEQHMWKCENDVSQPNSEYVLSIYQRGKSGNVPVTDSRGEPIKIVGEKGLSVLKLFHKLPVHYTMKTFGTPVALPQSRFPGPGSSGSYPVAPSHAPSVSSTFPAFPPSTNVSDGNLGISSQGRPRSMQNFPQNSPSTDMVRYRGTPSQTGQSFQEEKAHQSSKKNRKKIILNPEFSRFSIQDQYLVTDGKFNESFNPQIDTHFELMRKYIASQMNSRHRVTGADVDAFLTDGTLPNSSPSASHQEAGPLVVYQGNKSRPGSTGGEGRYADWAVPPSQGGNRDSRGGNRGGRG